MSPRAKAAWHRLVPELDRLGILTVLDHGALAHLCEKEAIAEDAYELIVRDGLVVPGDKGVKKNPAIQIHRDATTELRLLYKEFGLTPSSRSAFDLPDNGEPSAMKKLLAGRPD